MKFRITGVNEKTHQHIHLSIEATSRQEAISIAAGKGIAVHAVMQKEMTVAEHPSQYVTASTVVFGLIVVVGIALGGYLTLRLVAEDPLPDVSSSPSLPRFQPLHNRLSSAKRKVDRAVLVTESASEVSLRALLEHQYQEIRSRLIYERPGHIIIRLYDSRDNYYRLKWLAQLQMTPDDEEPRIQMRDSVAP